MVFERFGRSASAAMILFWAASLFLPAVRYCAVNPGMAPQTTWDYGMKLFLFGWAGPVEGLFGWFANPTLLLAAVAIASRERPWTWLSLAPMFFAATALAQSGFIRDFDAGPYRACGWGGGFWLWVSACAIPAALQLWDWSRRGARRPLPGERLPPT